MQNTISIFSPDYIGDKYVSVFDPFLQPSLYGETYLYGAIKDTLVLPVNKYIQQLTLDLLV